MKKAKLERAISKTRRSKTKPATLSRPVSSRRSKNIESHFVDSGQVTSPCDTTGQVQLINVIPQGATVNNRIGKKCMLQSVQIHGFFFPGTTAVINNMGAWLVLDRQSNGAALPAITDILVSANTNDFANDAKAPRFKILRRWDCVMSGDTAGTDGPPNDLPNANLNDYIKLKYIMEFNTSAATGVQATIEKGALYIVTAGSSAAGTTAGSFQFYTRTRFTEDF